MPLDQIRFAPRNPKGHDLDGIAGSIDLHGMGELPLLDERTGLLVAGHGRVDALRARHARGGSPPEGLTANDDGMWLMPVIRGWQSSSDAAAESYLIGSNEWTAIGGWADEQELAAILIDLQRTDDALLAATGYDIDRLDALMAELDDADPEFEPTDDDTRLDRRSVCTCPECGHVFAPTTRVEVTTDDDG